MKKFTFQCSVGLLALSTTLVNGQDVNLGRLKKDGQPFRYVAIGGSLSAGISAGGINQRTQLAAFPNLLAGKMGAGSFRVPLFEGEFKDGSGQLVTEVRKGQLLITDFPNAAFDDHTELPVVTYPIENFAIPHMKVRELTVKEDEPGTELPGSDRRSYQHLNRFVNNELVHKSSYLDLLKSKVSKLDFFTWELGTDDFVDYYLNGAYGKQISYLTNDREGVFPENDLIKLLVERGAKGIIATVPDVLSMPYFNFYSYESIAKQLGKEVYIQRYQKNDVRLLDPRDRIVPSDQITGLFNSVSLVGRDADNPIGDEFIIGFEEIETVERYNSWIKGFAEENKIALLDLHGIYKEIINGTFKTDDGSVIDASYPSGNFFSADGITPTALGQAVIANEFIKEVNKFYGSKIQLVDLSTVK